MLGRSQSISTQLQLPKLLATLQPGVLSQLSATGAWATPGDFKNILTSLHVSSEAAVSSAQSEAKEAARELGLDAVPLGQLRGTSTYLTHVAELWDVCIAVLLVESQGLKCINISTLLKQETVAAGSLGQLQGTCTD